MSARALRSLFFFVVVAFAAVGCTRTVFVIQQPDGSLKAVTEQEAEAALAQVDEAVEAVGDESTDESTDGVPASELPSDTDVTDDTNADHAGVAPPIDLDGPVTLGVDPRNPIDLPEDMVIVDIAPANDFVLYGDGAPVYLQVTLQADENAIGPRTPLDIAIVIDRSGSMSGQKIRDVKEAARWMVSNLPDGDRVAIISYATDVRVDRAVQLDDAGRSLLLRAIDDINHGGGTNLSGGLEAGVDEILEWRNDGERLQRVVLLSDGNANHGIIDQPTLGRMSDGYRERGVSVTTMGVGLDYNEDIMEEVATAGGGNYYFIEDSVALAGIFDAEMGALAGTVVRNAEVVLDVPDGVEIAEVYGFKHKQEGDKVRVFMNSVPAGSRKRALMAVNVPKKHKGELVIAQASVEYRNELSKSDVRADLNPVTVSYTKDKKKVSKGMNVGVAEKVERVRNAEARRQVFAALEEGKRSEAEKIVRSRKKEAKSANKVIASDALDMEIGALGDLEQTVAAVPKDEKKARRHRDSSGYKRKKKASKSEAYMNMAD